MYVTAIICVISMTIGNFLWQAFKEQHQWSIAIERSFFQACAIATFLIVLACL